MMMCEITKLPRFIPHRQNEIKSKNLSSNSLHFLFPQGIAMMMMMSNLRRQ